MVKNLPTMQKTRVQSLGWEDPLEKGMTTHSIILVQRILWTEEPGRLQSMLLPRVRHGSYHHFQQHNSPSRVILCRPCGNIARGIIKQK